MKVKCGACGAMGHMKTNRTCPKFNPNDPENQVSVNVALTEKDEEDHLMDLEHADGEELINVDGTKVTLSSKVRKLENLALKYQCSNLFLNFIVEAAVC